MGRAFNTAGDAGWPYIETDSLNFRHQQEIADMRDTHCLLLGLDELKTPLDNSCFDGDHNATLRGDVKWRGGHLGTGVRYWDTVASDLPYQGSDEVALRATGPLSAIKPNTRSRDYQILSQHPAFLEAQLVRNPFRCFHRA